MRAWYQDMRRALGSRWFIVAVTATAFTLWLGIGELSYRMLHASAWSGQISWLAGIENALSAQLASIALPALSALPFATQGFAELRTGAFRMAAFRAGTSAYRFGKTAACANSGMLTQLIAFCLFLGLLYLLYLRGMAAQPMPSAPCMRRGEETLPFLSLAECLSLWPQLVFRLSCGGAWACLGGSLALITRSALAAYIGPLTIRFCLSFVAGRFFPDVSWLSPSAWSAVTACAVGLAFLLLSMLLFAGTLQEEMKRHA